MNEKLTPIEWFYLLKILANERARLITLRSRGLMDVDVVNSQLEIIRTILEKTKVKLK